MLKNGEGGYVADAATLDRLEGEGRVVARYLDDNPNGSLRDIAGVTNERGNVVGLMPHPEHAVEDLTGSGTDGLASSPRWPSASSADPPGHAASPGPDRRGADDHGATSSGRGTEPSDPCADPQGGGAAARGPRGPEPDGADDPVSTPLAPRLTVSPPRG